MSKGEVKTVFKCVVCGRAWTSKQSLRAHMKVHRSEGYTTTHIVVKREDWGRFKKICEDHKTTTCSLLGALIVAAIKGEELGVINVGGENPAVIQVNQYFSGKPRSSLKAPLSSKITPVISCRLCGSLDVYEWIPEFTRALEGRCRSCGASWLVDPGRNSSRDLSLHVLPRP